jgi:hypothetical protein
VRGHGARGPLPPRVVAGGDHDSLDDGPAFLLVSSKQQWFEEGRDGRSGQTQLVGEGQAAPGISLPLPVPRLDQALRQQALAELCSVLVAEASATPDFLLRCVGLCPYLTRCLTSTPTSWARRALVRLPPRACRSAVLLWSPQDARPPRPLAVAVAGAAAGAPPPRPPVVAQEALVMLLLVLGAPAARAPTPTSAWPLVRATLAATVTRATRIIIENFSCAASCPCGSPKSTIDRQILSRPCHSHFPEGTNMLERLNAVNAKS